ncbi:putative porin [Algoriphagus sp. oki45]|uniref:putative porin n=1 Tax=Algoriphagus sp. oki45 TaxID=3067294 RepID=UPI0027F08D9D|nr:putative porin [Algoriphagus sp. oki45]
MIRKGLVLAFFFALLSLQGIFAQRPVQGNPPTGRPIRPEREVINPEEEEEQEGRRTLLDDSTRMVYGPKTSLYFFEKDIRRNSLTLYEQDTLLDNFHNYDPVQKGGWKYQDLANIGSATKPVFYQVPELIGTTSGFHAYDLYFVDPAKRRYFDTKSPFTEMSAFFGGGNRNMLDVYFARNVNPRWNVGFDFRTERIRKTLNPDSRDDYMTEQNAYGLHTNYRSENGRYWLLGAFSRMRHLVNEIGGIIPPEVDSTSLYYTYEDAKVWLQNSQAIDLRQDYHLYHEYKLGNGLQVYHVFDRKIQKLTFLANLNTTDSSFYNSNRFQESDTTQNFHGFSEWRNELGVKGTYKGFFYNAYTKLRNARFENPFFEDGAERYNEFYIGGELIGKISDKWSLQADGEYLLTDAFRIHGKFVSPWLEAEYTKALYRPTAMQQRYFGNHFRWDNDFVNVGVDQIQGKIKLDFVKGLSLRPMLTLNRVNNYVYFDENLEVAQANGEVFMFMPGLQANAQLGKKFRLDLEVIYTELTGAASDVVRIPNWYANTRIYFDSPMFDENIFVQLGLDIRYKSSFFAEAYNPSYQQFHLQNDFNVFAYPVADLFLNFRINRTRVLFKYNHLNSGLMNNDGYFVTPDYTGYRSFLDLGITWYLFD